MSVPKHIEEFLTQNNMTLPTTIETGDAIMIKNPKKRRKCPLCRRNLYLYYINFEQMFLMCEDDHCDFPFGYEPLQIVYDESQLVHNPPPATPVFWEFPVGGPGGVPLPPPVATTIDTSTTQSSNAPDWDDQSSLAGDEGSIAKQEILSVRLSKQNKKRKEQKDYNNIITKKLNKFKQLNEALNECDGKNMTTQQINNKKWLKNLNYYQNQNSQTAKELIKAVEVKLLKKEEPNPEHTVELLEISIDSKAKIPKVEIQILKKPKLE